jgi:DNA-binding response OmpR family regulator
MESEVRALIVDDDKTSCELLAEILDGKGFEAVWTTRALQGYKLAESSAFDLFILDVRMPGILGTELAAALKQERPGAQIILISAFADEALRETASNLGVALLSKPFSPDQLLDLIQNREAEEA